MSERKIAHFTIMPTPQGIVLQSNGKTFVDTLHKTLDSPLKSISQSGILTLSKSDIGYILSDQKEPYLQ
jgi:hypothetical protein